MKFSIVNIGTVGNATGATLTLSATVPTGATIFVCVTEKSTSGTDGTLGDTVNTYSKLTSGSLAATAADGRGMLFAVTNAGALSSGTITYTRNLSGSAAAMAAFYVTGATGAATFTEGLVTATGTTGTITVTSGSLGAGDLVLGVLFDSGSSTAGGNATFTQDSTNGAYTTPPVEIKSAAGTAQARIDGGQFFKAASGTQVYAPTMSSTAQQWFLAVLGIIPAPDSGIVFDRPALPSRAAQPFDPPNLLASTLAPPFVDHTKIFRGPLFARPPDAWPKATGEPLATATPLLLTAPFVNPHFSNEDLSETVRFRANPITDLAPISPLFFPNPAQPFVQSDWLRQPALPKAVGEVQGTLNALLTPNPARPFTQSDWPNALAAKPRAIGEPLSGVSALLTPNPAQPFSQLDWYRIAPAQRAKVDDALNLTPFLPAPVVTVQFSELDWPRPRDPQSKAQLTDQQNLLTSTLAPPVVVDHTKIFRAPLIARLPDAWPKAKVDDPGDLTISLPVVTVTVVFAQLDWPNPVRTPPKVTGEPIGGVIASVAVAQPFVESLWDSATKAYPKATGEVVGTLSPILTPNPSRPFAQNLWDLAVRGWPKAIGEAAATLNALLTPNPAQPFSQSDWTRILTTSKAKVDDFAYLQTLYSVVVVARPLHQDNWPNVPRAPAAQKSDVYRGPNPLITPNPARPFIQADWPRSTDSIKLKAVGEPIGRLAPLLTPNPAQPFVQSDWFQIRSTQKAKIDDFLNLFPLHAPQTVPFGIGPRRPLLTQAVGVQSGGGGGGFAANYWPDGPQIAAQGDPVQYVTENGTIFYVDQSGNFYVAE